jgi:hypothetical protein
MKYILKSRKFIAMAVICCSLTGCVSKGKETAESGDSKELKVMVWNILHGGKNEDLPADGRPDVIRIIKQSEADVILMIETYGCAPMVADSLGFHYELLSSNLCIFSRFPIREKIVFPDQISTFNFGGVQLLVDGIPVHVFNTWLHYLPDTRLVPLDKTEEEILAWENEGTRDEEVKQILEAIRDYTENADRIPVIMGGDFNSHSHLDWTEATRGMYNHGNQVVNWTVSVEMAQAGFEDTYRKIHPDPVKNIGTTWLGVRDSTGNLLFTRRDRIDYLYSKGKNLIPKDSYAGVAPFSQEFLYKGKTVEHYPSDHGFVLTTFELLFQAGL